MVSCPCFVTFWWPKYTWLDLLYLQLASATFYSPSGTWPLYLSLPETSLKVSSLSLWLPPASRVSPQQSFTPESLRTTQPFSPWVTFISTSSTSPSPLLDFLTFLKDSLNLWIDSLTFYLAIMGFHEDLEPLPLPVLSIPSPVFLLIIDFLSKTSWSITIYNNSTVTLPNKSQMTFLEAGFWNRQGSFLIL